VPKIRVLLQDSAAVAYANTIVTSNGKQQIRWYSDTYLWTNGQWHAIFANRHQRMFIERLGRPFEDGKTLTISDFSSPGERIPSAATRRIERRRLLSTLLGESIRSRSDASEDLRIYSYYALCRDVWQIR
jgi:hypothetical protein